VTEKVFVVTACVIYMNEGRKKRQKLLIWNTRKTLWCSQCLLFISSVNGYYRRSENL